MKSTFPSLRWTFAGAVALAFAATTTMFAQGVTTSGISGFVTNKAGQAISGATVTAVLDATGARYAATTRSAGQYSLSGLTSGGPYTVTATASGLPAAEKKDVYLNLGQTTAVDLEISTEIVRLEAVNVSESAANTTFDMSSMGTGSNFNTKQILQISSIRRDLQDFESLDPRAVTQQVSPSDPAYTFSVAGQNPRENAILVDGVSAADNFGMN